MPINVMEFAKGDADGCVLGESPSGKFICSDPSFVGLEGWPRDDTTLLNCCFEPCGLWDSNVDLAKRISRHGLLHFLAVLRKDCGNVRFELVLWEDPHESDGACSPHPEYGAHYGKPFKSILIEIVEGKISMFDMTGGKHKGTDGTTEQNKDYDWDQWLKCPFPCHRR